MGIVVTARPLVAVLFGAQWSPCVPYLQILCLGGILWPLHILNLNILLAQGHSNLFFRLEIIKKTFGILIMGIACFFGITAIAWSSVLTGVVCFWINAHYSGRFLDYGFLRQIIDLLPYAGVSLVMAGCVWAITLLPLSIPILILATQVSLGVVLYLALCATLRLRAFLNAWSIVRAVLARRLAPTVI